MDLGYRTATALLSDLEARRVGSLELLDHLLARTDRHNPPLNAVVVRDTEQARERARQADDARRRGQSWGPLHGLPMTVKECFDVAGLPTTAGSPGLKANAAQRHADAVQRLVDAGAIIFGKTNVPLFAGDLQTYNEVYGTTNNPWNTACGPGGSSGGSAAALAAGLTPLELGSDIGGSIRNPAHFCGVYGHKPSYGLVSMRGHVPGPPNSLLQVDIAVVGPMARSADDLDLALSIVAGPDEFNAPAWRVDLPPPRQVRRQDYRIAVCADDPFCPVDNEITDLIRAAAQALSKAGAKVADAKPALDFGQSFRTYYQMLAATMSADFPEPVMQGLEAKAVAAGDSTAYRDLFARGATMRHATYIKASAVRQKERAIWGTFFRDWDVFLCPVLMTAAFPHDHAPDMLSRRLTVNGQARPYVDAMRWAGLIGNVRLPVATVPVGRTKAGLPVGMQIVGPYLEDRTAIDVAKWLADLIGGFTPPPGYGD
ncbi:amidase [Reyranella sp. CPCC 100927]|uniref:amidase n=1 Tax=Reyranella sp. CPCC 100927 TaxID=2599616 RepID=UPI0011B7D5CE|nr:amidase [Reyranella sp. CPCC 100927]TWT09623.1 amidase [Reyranella sp. CPCC 100927]